MKMNTELLKQYQSQTVDKGICIFTNSTCELKDHCNGIARSKCHEQAKSVFDHNSIDLTICSYLMLSDEEGQKVMDKYFKSINDLEHYHFSDY